MPQWELTVSFCSYATRAIVAALLVRAFISTFKAWAMGGGEHLKDGETSDASMSASWRKRWWIAFSGFPFDAKVNDYWLPLIIGVSELMVYPVLLAANQFEVIGGWIAIKTAGQWRAWEHSRTAFNRFLVGNLCSLAISYFWLADFVRIQPTDG